MTLTSTFSSGFRVAFAGEEYRIARPDQWIADATIALRTRSAVAGVAVVLPSAVSVPF